MGVDIAGGGGLFARFSFLFPSSALALSMFPPPIFSILPSLSHAKGSEAADALASRLCS